QSGVRGNRSRTAMSEALPYFSLAVAVGALLVAIFVAMRAGRWRESDGAKEMAGAINKLDHRLTTVEADMRNVATKADIASLKSEVEGLERLAKNTDQAVTRIEGHLMGVRG
ncbi:MAG TPA: DUF2730 family protein, partial [Caulobacter sp.]|nr:DUF2730 family protein [Caulobacter sp.]